MKKQEILQKLSTYIYETSDIAKVGDKFVTLLNGTRVSTTKYLSQYLDRSSLSDAGVLDDVVKNKIPDSELIEGMQKELSQLFYELHKVDLPDTELPGTNVAWESFIPILDYRTGDVILYNNNMGGISDLGVKAWETAITKEMRKAAYIALRTALLEYDPYDITPFKAITHEKMEILRVNTYRPPDWRKSPSPDDTSCPPEIWSFLKHLFPDEGCLEYVLNWLYLALIERSEVYLLLSGSKGIGKGVFSRLLSMLVGRDHFIEAPDSLLKSHFNAALDKKRIILFDEFRVGKSEHTKLKRYANRFQNIEKKGMDADKSKEIFNSYVISNNDVTDMYLESDDRRFSVVDMTIKPLDSIMEVDEITSFSQRLEDDEDLALRFGYYIFHHGKCDKYDQFSIWKGRRFFDLVYNSLTDWQRFIVDIAVSGEEDVVNLKTLRKNYSREIKKSGGFTRFPQSRQKVIDFLGNYRHEGEWRIGEVKLDETDDEYAIYVNPELTKIREVEELEELSLEEL